MAEQTIRKGLWEPILEQGIQNTHFFNGRLLTALDLKTEQDANRQHHQQLGQAIGEGVVRGLEVNLIADGSSGKPPIVSVTRGHALNRAGQVIALPMDVEVMLARQSQALPPEAGLFIECPNSNNGASSTGKGAYILVATPASGFREKTRMRGFEQDGKVTGCGSRYAVEGIKFRLEELDVEALPRVTRLTRDTLKDLLTQIDPSTRTAPVDPSTLRNSLSKLRNLLAHICFGTEELANFAQDPFAREEGHSLYVTYGALDGLRLSGKITSYDVPLALLYWPTSGVQFVDIWSIRRRLVQPLFETLWPLHIGQRRLSEAEAMFLQFQGQLDDMLAQEEGLISVAATDRFQYLPPAGYLPIGIRQFSRDVFFRNLDVERIPVDPAFLGMLVHQSWFLAAIDLTIAPPLYLYEAPEHPDYLLFVRRERQLDRDQLDIPPSPGTTSRTGRIDIALDAREALRAADKVLGKIFGPEGKLRADIDIKIWAEDELGNKYDAVFISTTSSIDLSRRGKEFKFDRGLAHFTIRELPPGFYQVHAKLKQFKEATRKAEVEAGQTVKVVFELVQETKKPGTKKPKPEGGGKADWIDPSWFEKLFFIDKYVDWPWPPPEIRSAPDFGPVINPVPREVQILLQDWADWLQTEYPEAPVDPGDIGLYLNSNHTGSEISTNPYAYVVFGDRGVYMPVVLTPVDHSLGRSVPITKGNLAGVDRDAERRLEAIGLTDIDVLGASWTGLVADAMEISLETAGNLISETRDKVDGLQNSLQIFTGVDAGIETTLKNLGINNAVDLANANPQDIIAAAGNSLAFARRLVDEAQRAVPESFWSLRAGTLGFDDEQIAAMNALGIKTQGVLKTRTTTAATRAEVETALRLSASELDSLVGRIDLGRFSTEIIVGRIGRAPTTRVVGVNRESASALAGIGVGNLRALALADVNAVANVLGGDMARATNLINTARARVHI
jgi:hypothetical protein